jgi:hypothetical protein
MRNPEARRPEFVVGPLGERLTLQDLPSPETGRWVARRKAQLALAIQGGLISFEEASSRYSLSLEELTEWMCWETRFGLKGLRAGKLQYYKNALRRERDREQV